MATAIPPSNLPQLLILMKGHPGTGKSTLSRHLAKHLSIPLLDKDDIRDSTLPLQHLPTFNPTVLNTLSYTILAHLTKTQLHLGLSLIVDSPLSRKPIFDRMAEAAAAVGAKVMVVECRPGDVEEWRRRVEGRKGESWHKPCCWKDVVRLIEGYNGCFEYDVGEVPRIVVDTTETCDVGDVVCRVVESIRDNVC